ncbi:MAG: hypothetical protein HOW73_31795 [Polyangiaceae bacterium]|nr:hypothetical protein [Polyangiaceae bacterium]
MNEPVPARPSAVEPPLAAYDDPEDALGWSMLAVVLVAALGWLFIPFTLYAILVSIAAFITTLYLMAKDAITHRQHPALSVIGGVLLFPAAFLVQMHARRRWGATWLLPHAAVALGAVVVGIVFHGAVWGPEARVTVSCRAAGTTLKEGYLCTPKHLGGIQDARACWDLSITCKNGTHVSEHVCAIVTLGSAHESKVPFDYSPGFEECDEIGSASVDDLRVEIDPRRPHPEQAPPPPPPPPPNKE